MCGIAGFVGAGDKDVLSRMISTLDYRGPDDSGIWKEGSVGLAHSRLSIIDVSALGHQPMSSLDGNVIITFNGEIYNYRELKLFLEKRGKSFRSKSDTEVIVQMYEVYGEQSFEKFKGMFSFGIYDKRKGSLFLVRDRFGEKPLYWTIQQGTLVFASEAKAVLQHFAVQKKISPNAVLSYLTYDAVLTPECIFEKIQKLEPATYLEYSNGTASKHVYWNPPQNTLDISFDEARDRLDSVFSESVMSQMVADVPVGVFLSGGLDSSIISYYAQRQNQDPVHTFSLGFEDASYDESMYARKVAYALGTEHHEKIVTPKEMRESLEVVIDKLDEPLSDPAIVPNYLLSEFAREHVKVALGGDGGDELFAGYQTFTAQKFLSWYRLLPLIVRNKLVEPVVNNLPVSHTYFSLDFKVKQFIRGDRAQNKYVHQAWLESFNFEERKEILSPAYKEFLYTDQYRRIDEYVSEVPEDINMQTTYFYLRTYLLDVILNKVDRSSMYNSLEVRSPFLDVDLVELALQIPWRYKHRGVTGKYILRALMKKRLPKDIVSRSKHGFGLPVGQWLRGEWREFLLDTLSEDRLIRMGIFDPRTVQRIIHEHIDGSHNHRKKLWSLLIFSLWYDRWNSS